MSKIERFDIQRRVVSHMVTTSWQNVPHVAYLYEPDQIFLKPEVIRKW